MTTEANNPTPTSLRDGKQKMHSIALTIVEGEPVASGTIRKSHNAPRRALVLGIIQVLIILHVLQWWWTGRTISPIEPSEAMEFSKRGLINAGVVFFVLTLLATLALGRWFCGWGCHLVMLQDLCGWLMRKCGIRPKPFRSRVLIYVPLILGLYMFIWPVFYRLAVAPWSNPDLAWPGFSVQFVTTDFWGTFPGWLLAVPFLLVCGFGTVYFLGAKGFCTYACPYGGLYAQLDKFAPGRIRVTDACEGCGHCTATCSSNVRVHEEVREYGMVVDPGCMKCLDCVSVCPNDALYFGFGKTAVGKGPAKNATPERNYDLSWREEIVFALVFVLIFFAFRGMVVRFPLLMTAGLVSIITWLLWRGWRLQCDTNVRVHRFQLKLSGRIRPGGWGFVAIVTIIALLTIHAGVLNLAYLNAARFDEKVTLSQGDVFGPGVNQVSPDQEKAATQAIRWYGFVSGFNKGGFGWITSSPTHIRLAWLHSCLGDYDAALSHLQHVESSGAKNAQL
ncbi:MAG: 4Fe-4S binding protein, partial [Planctomycetota bacterium]|nr:4Fe-4S binding protein [Planctomycetota bacterium]